MAEITNSQRVHPVDINPNDYTQNDDVESANSDDLSSKEIKDLKLKKRMRRLAYVTALVLFLTVAVLVFSLTITRMRNPKFRIRTINIEHLEINSEEDNYPSMELKLNAEVLVKNNNFGHFAFDEGSIRFIYHDFEIGEVTVEESDSSARSIKEIDLKVELDIEESLRLGDDVKKGFLTLKSSGKLYGKVHLMKLIRKEKTAEMSCSIVINLVKRVVHDLTCEL